MKSFHPRTALLAAIALLTIPLWSAHAVAAPPEQTAPQGEDPPGADNGATPPAVEHDGVITPPPTGDEGIHTEVPNPNAGHPEEVIPPPGTPGGDPKLDPR